MYSKNRLLFVKKSTPFQIPGHGALTIWQWRGWNALQLKGIMHWVSRGLYHHHHHHCTLEQLYTGQWPVVIKRIASSSQSHPLHQFIIITITVKSNYTLVIKRISLQLICPTTTGTSVHYIRLMCTNANHPAYKATWAFHMRPLLLVFAPFMHAK